MSRVITAEDVRKRLSLQDDTGINSAIESSLDGALVRVSTLLMTNLPEGTAQDVFFVDPTSAVAHQGLHTLRLSNGFVQAPVSCYVADTLEGVLTSTDQLTGTILRAEQGHLRVPEQYTKRFIRVDYGYGFVTNEPVPGWLKEVVMSLTILIMASQQISDGKSELAELIPSMERHWTGIMDTKLRFSSLAISALN